MTARDYEGFAYRQATDEDSPWLFAFVATAEDISQWAGIPRRADSQLVGFQRAAEASRVEAAKTFFDTPTNQSPTSVAIGLHPASDDVVSFSLGGPLGDDAAVSTEDSPGIYHARLSVSGDFDNMSAAQAVARIRKYIEERLSSSPEYGQIDAERLPDDDSALDGGGEDEDDDDPRDAPRELELGESILRELSERLDDPEWVDANLEDIRALAKPATVIDGQHRLLGAEAAERGIPFSVIAMVSCPWAEQVFQFTVVNYTAKAIPDKFITANAALSLTMSELEQLEDRLTQAGVKVTEYDLMTAVNFDTKSPFYDFVDLSEDKRMSGSKIGYKTMVRIARSWYDGKSPLFRDLLLPNLYPDLPGKTSAIRNERLARWREGDWALFFVSFWSQVKETYAGTDASLWVPGSSQLMVAIVLLELQSAYLRNLQDQDETFFEVSADPEEARAELLEKLRSRADKLLAYIPVAFFKTSWKMSSLSTGAGRQALQQALGELVSTKGKYTWKHSTLVAGPK